MIGENPWSHDSEKSQGPTGRTVLSLTRRRGCGRPIARRGRFRRDDAVRTLTAVPQSTRRGNI